MNIQTGIYIITPIWYSSHCQLHVFSTTDAKDQMLSSSTNQYTGSTGFSLRAYKRTPISSFDRYLSNVAPFNSTFPVKCIDTCQCCVIIPRNLTTKDLIRQLFNRTLVIQYDGIRRVMKSPSAINEPDNSSGPAEAIKHKSCFIQ